MPVCCPCSTQDNQGGGGDKLVTPTNVAARNTATYIQAAPSPGADNTCPELSMLYVPNSAVTPISAPSAS